MKKYLSYPALVLTAMVGGLDKNIIAFQNPDQSIVLVVHNDSTSDKLVRIQVGKLTIAPVLKGDSFNTLLIKQ